MNARVMVSTDFSAYRHLTGTVIAVGKFQRLVRLDIMPEYPMMFELRELLWL